ncbi:flagellar basal-body rod modification protein FlgD [Caloramator fervidus]|uniref:Flagellar basal-body rod modification protein FlgD n=1 Tax=Caloramator fervidus TaxID=29344 RepID=A0A1H5SEL1_9CLOT|nr:flagellar hook capping FlgD N-terminal domain-containing protein [Caloramator fervidus]SEF48271.1 flagellar basal-body rod modification protein FlgD [Caloramator fervidus]
MEVSKVLNNSSEVQQLQKKDILDKDAFLKILTVQLRHQDPLNAKDNTEYIAQMAQFAALEQMQNLNNSLQKLLLSQKLMEGTVLIGKQVEFDVGSSTVIDKVTSVKVEGGQVYLKTEKGIYKIEQVLSVGDVLGDKQDQ